MRNLSRVILVFVLLLLVTSIATAGGPDFGSFSTTGYTTNLVENILYPPDFGPVIPSEFTFLPSGHIKFHISAQGGPAVDDDQLCYDLYNDLYGGILPNPDSTPGACAVICDYVDGDIDGEPLCGTTGAFDSGSFTFEEWGVYYPEPSEYGYIGANHGLMTIIAEAVDFRFAGQVTEAFQVEGNFEGEEGEGVYSGDANYVFTVDYTPCKKGNCQRCAVFGEDQLGIEGNTLTWTFTNEGNKKINIQNITLNWLGSDTPLKKVRLGGKTIYDQKEPASWTTINADWNGKVKDRQIKKGKQAKLTFEFEDADISQNLWDYTILVEFAKGCAVTFVDFDPNPPATTP